MGGTPHARSMPPREFHRSMESLSTSASDSPPREDPQAVKTIEGEPRRRIFRSHIHTAQARAFASPGKEKARDRLHRIQECFQRASQGEWKGLMERVLIMTVPRYEQDESQPLATCADSLPPRTAKRLYKAASQGQLGKAWRQLRAPPPVFIGPEYTHAISKLKRNKAADAGGPSGHDL